MTIREQKIWDTVHAWAKHQNPGIPDDNLRGLMDDVLGVVESEVQAERRRVWGVVARTRRQSWRNADWYDAMDMLLNKLFPHGEPTEKRSQNAAPRLDDPAE